MKMKRAYSLILAFVLTLSLFMVMPTSVFAANTEEITLTLIPNNNETANNTFVYGEKATIKGTSVKIYEDLYYGAHGIEVALAENTEIDLITAYSFSNGAVVYRFDYWGSESPELYDAVLDYFFISATDLVGNEDAAPEVTPNPDPEETPDDEDAPVVEEDGKAIVDFGSMDKDMYISPFTLTLHGNHIDDLDSKAVSDVNGEKVHVCFYYELSDGTVRYKVAYNGSNSALRDAIAGGYEFVNAADLYEKAEPEPAPEPEETPEEEDAKAIVDFGSMDKDMYISPYSLTLYGNHIDDVDDKAVSGVNGEKVHVCFYYELSDGTVRYKVAYNGSNSALRDAIAGGYEFVNAADLYEKADPEPAPEPEETPEEEDAKAIVDFGSMDKDMYISLRNLTLYRNHIDDVDDKTVSGVKGEKVHVYFYYELADGTVRYKVEYTGRNSALKKAIAQGYEFVNAEDLYEKATNTRFSNWRF